MRALILIFTLLVIWSCNPEKGSTKLYLSNISLDDFDTCYFAVSINHQIVVKDTVENKHVSPAYWSEHEIKIPKTKFNFLVEIKSNGSQVLKDTTLDYNDSLKIFVRFNFYPRYKRYWNPEIYKYITKETTRFKKIADSLYASGALENASEYLNDTIPLKKNIEIIIR